MATPLYPWIIQIGSSNDSRYGVQVRDIQSGNDGDVCLSLITHKLLKDKSIPHVIDIGADEGWWSIFVADINPTAIIDAFEPNPESFVGFVPYLSSVPQLRLHTFAISDHSGFLPFHPQKGQSHSRTESTMCVPCTTLDRYIHNSHVDMIKIDTEGHELRILRTLHPYLNTIGAIVFECTVFWNGSTEEECIASTRDELIFLKQHYKYMYSLSRRDFPPQLLPIVSENDIYRYVSTCYIQHLQTDILVCNERMD